jgi:DNA invertase Pin-like site-specific DNA recombinase
MSEESRLGRESIEVSYALKQLVQAGVRVWLYLDNRERTLDSPTDKILMSLVAYADELEREKARRVTDTMLRRRGPGTPREAGAWLHQRARMGRRAADPRGRGHGGASRPLHPWARRGEHREAERRARPHRE